ncbi:MAG: UvrD-helicase domain-containing protein [Thermoanaerobaculum sp.]|nr:UvrD-helicase domain-containing protein [Thermoanaerobaculum sp.]
MSYDLVDQDTNTRRLAVQEFERPLLVEAGAGTGKTALLVARVLAWSLGPGWEKAEKERCQDPREVAAAVASGVVAVTFTEKAAAEMSARLATALVQLQQGKTPQGLEMAALPEQEEVRHARAHALLLCLDRYLICTLHAFCRRLLLRYPLEAQLHPDFQVDGEWVQVPEAAEELVRRKLAEPSPFWGERWGDLARFGVTPKDMVELLQALVAAGVDADHLRNFPWEAQLAELRDRTRQALGQLAALVRPLADSPQLKKAAPIWEVADALAMAEDHPQTFFAQLLERWAQVGGELKLRAWARGEFAKNEAVILGSRLAELQAVSRQLDGLLRCAARVQPELWPMLLGVAAELLTELRQELTSRLVLTYQDLLVLSVKVLETHPPILERERRRLAQLLVDEFQDTDRWQAALVRLLALGPDSPRPGLFLVGDPKQSIYGWRSADLAVYDRIKREVEEVGGQVLPLVVNYRSVGTILEEVGRVMRVVMREEEGVQPAFQELVAHRGKGEGINGDGRFPVEYWICGGVEGPGLPSGPMHVLREQEAKALAAHLLELHQDGVPFEDMAVLLRSFTDVEVYLEALRNHGVPYTVTHDRTFFQRRDILDLTCLLQAVADPQDSLALVGFLRSPWVGVPDAAWWGLQEGGFFTQAAELSGLNGEKLAALRTLLDQVAAALPADLPGRRSLEGWEDSAFYALVCLALLRESYRQEPPHRFFSLLREQLLLLPTAAARFLGPFRVATLERLLRLVERQLLAGAPLTQALEWVRRAGARPQEERGAQTADLSPGVVVTTIHQAKGLGFGHVFLMDVGRSSTGRAFGEVEAAWVPGGLSPLGEDLVLAVGQWVTPNAWRLWEWREKVEAAETVRVLYVAMTRARDRLVISGHWNPARAQGSLVRLIKQREHFPPLDQRFSQLADGSAWEEDGVLWVLPTRRQPRRRGAPGAWKPAPELERLQEEGQRLAESRRVAGCREQLSVSASMSGEAHEELHRQLEAWADQDENQSPWNQDVSLWAGTVVHRALQRWDFNRAPEAELDRQRQLLHSYLLGVRDPEVRSAAKEKAQEILQRFAEGQLFPLFCALKNRVLGREIPLFTAADGSRAWGFFSGAADLLYEEPGGLVVVDFKTDQVEGEAVQRRAEAYLSQGRRYAQALQGALGLAKPPAFELWFLWCGRRWRFDLDSRPV